MTHDASQNAWVDAARRGDAAAFGRLVSCHYRTVWGVAYSVVGDPTAAEDIAQDTFLTAWTHLGKLRASGAFPMWTRKIARNLSKNWLRSKTYRQRLAERYGSEDRPAGEAASEASLRHERRELVRAALNTLTPRVREVMVLFYLEERSVSEVADTLDISEQAVKSRLFQGRNKLREALLDKWELELRDELKVPDQQPAVTRISAGLALGPAVPAISGEAAKGGAALWLHHLFHEGAELIADPTIWGSAALSAKKAAAAIGLVAIAGLGTWYATREPAEPAVLTEQEQPTTSATEPLLADAEIPRPAERSDALSKPKDNAADPATREVLVERANFVSEPPTDSTLPSAIIPSFVRALANEGRIPEEDDFASVAGRVVDEAGRPIDGAAVEVVVLGKGPARANSEAGVVEHLSTLRDTQRRFEARTAADGSYLVDNICFEGAALLRVTKAGYRVAPGGFPDVTMIRPGDQITGLDAVMTRGLTLWGEVVNASGRPVTDATVHVVGFQDDDSRSRGHLGQAYTDGEGRFQLVFEKPGDAALHVVSDVSGESTFAAVPVFDGATARLEIADPAAMRGVITRQSGEPAAGVWLQVQGKWRNKTNEEQSHAEIYYALTDEAGRYAIDRIDADLSYSVVLRTDDGDTLTAPINLGVLEAGAERIWNYTLQDGILVAGTVFGQATNQPLRNVYVALRRADSMEILYEEEVAADGSYEVKVSEGPGDYIIYAKFAEVDPNAYGFPTAQEITLMGGKDYEVDLTMLDPVQRSLKLVDTNGIPIASAQVGIREYDSTRMPVGATDAEGRFSYGGLIPLIETQFLVTTADGRSAGSASLVGQPGEVMPEELIVVYESSGIEGGLIGEDGQALAYRDLQVIIEYGQGATVRFSATSDGRGRFAMLDGVPATDVNVTVRVLSEEQDLAWRAENVPVLPNTIANLGVITPKPDEALFNGPEPPAAVFPELIDQ